jgi:hypothetical protein
LPFLASVVSDDVDAGVLPFQVALRSARDGLSQSARQILAPFLELGWVSESQVQERLSGAIDIVASKALRDRLPAGDSAGRARLVRETGPGAAAWLTAVPLFQALQIEDECFRTALRTWLGLPYSMVAGIRLCACGEELQAGILGGQHLLRCGSGSDHNDTHHSIRDTMFYTMREAGYSVRREQSGMTPIREGEAGGRVTDLVAADPWGGSQVLADVVVADPTRSMAVMVTAVERGHAAQLTAEIKVGKYGDHFPDDTFIPLAAETYGCLDSTFDGFLRTCTRRAAELRAGGLGSVPMASRLISYYRSRVSISLQRSQVRAIHHRAARAVQSSTEARPLSVQDGFV